MMVVAGLGTGCGDLCDGAQAYCTGTTLNRCIDEHDSEDYWQAAACPAYCVALDQGATCAAEQTPRPACEGVDRWVRVCDGTEMIQCTEGYASVLFECPDPGLCEEQFGVCTARPGPQPKCSARTPLTDPFDYAASYCDGDAFIRCDGEFALYENICPPGQCIETAQAAGCKEVPDPDPNCTLNLDYPYAICVGSTTVKCLGGYRISSHGCSGGRCIPDSGGCQG